MAINNEFPILDGIAPSFGDLSCVIRGTSIAALKMNDINAISTNSTRERGEQRNAGGVVVRRTVGQSSRESSLTLYRHGVQNLWRNLIVGAQALGLVQGNQALIALVPFTIDYKHSPPGSDEIFQRILRGCMVDGAAMNSAVGTDAQTVEIPINTIQIVDVVDGVEAII
jgi:hypothetical protein